MNVDELPNHYKIIKKSVLSWLFIYFIIIFLLLSSYQTLLKSVWLKRQTNKIQNNNLDIMISLIPTFFFLHTYQSFCNGTFLLCTILCSVFILISRNVFSNIFKFVNPLSPRPSICHFTLPPFFFMFSVSFFIWKWV